MKTIFLENYAIYTLPQNNMPGNSGSPFPAPFLFLKEGILLSYPSSNKGKSKNIGICVEKVNGSNTSKVVSTSLLLSKWKEDPTELSFDRRLNTFLMTVPCNFWHII